MFEKTSRYYTVKTATLTVKDGNGKTRAIRYVLRRFIPSAEGQTTLLEHTVIQGERLDNLTARYLADPTQFWRVCDANNVLEPEELQTTGRVINIALPSL